MLTKHKPQGVLSKHWLQSMSEEKHTAPPKTGPSDGVERMTPALAAWEEQKLKLQARLKQQKEVERIARQAAGVFEPDWDASSSSSSSSSSPGVQNQKKKTTGTPAKGLETGSFDKREPDGSFDKREPAATSSAFLGKKGTPQRWRKSSKHRIAIDWFNTTYLARCMECLQRMWRHSRSCTAMGLIVWMEKGAGQIFGLGPPSGKKPVKKGSVLGWSTSTVAKSSMMMWRCFGRLSSMACSTMPSRPPRKGISGVEGGPT